MNCSHRANSAGSQRSSTYVRSSRPSVTTTCAIALMTATFVPGCSCRWYAASTCGIRTRSMRRGSMTTSWAPLRSRRFIREANTGWPSVGLAPMIIGANPTDGHPVFASRMKRRLRKGARLIVIDPRRIDLVKSPHVQADYHLPLKPGTNVAMINALAHVIVTEGLLDEGYVRERCDLGDFESWARFIADE